MPIPCAGQRRTSTAAAERFAHGRVAFMFDLAEVCKHGAMFPSFACRLTPMLRVIRRMQARQRHQSCPQRCCGRALMCPMHPRRSQVPRTRRCCAAWASSCRTCGWAAAAARSCAARRAGACRHQRCDVCRCACVPGLAHAAAHPQDTLHGALPRLMGVAAPGTAAPLDALIPAIAVAAVAAAPAAPLPAAADEEDDIFGDAGRDYVCEPAKRAAAAAAAAAAAPLLPRWYFGQSAGGGETAAVAVTAPTGAAGAADDLQGASVLAPSLACFSHGSAARRRPLRSGRGRG